MAYERLVPVGGLNIPEFLGCRFLGTMPAESEEHHVLRPGLPQVFAEAGDHRCAGRLFIAEYQESWVCVR